MTTGRQPTQAQTLTLITPIKQGFVESSPESHAGPTSPRACIRYAEQLKKVLEHIQEIPREQNKIEQLGAIHFARWVLIDNDQQLLFTSNFTGDLDQYLLDFSIALPDWVDMIWSHCDGYPGAQRFDEFRRWVRAHQIVEAYTYAANPAVTVSDIRWHQAFHLLYLQLVRDAQAEPHRLAELFAELQRKAHEIGLPAATPAPKADRAAAAPRPQPPKRTRRPAPKAPADVPLPRPMFAEARVAAPEFESLAP